MPSLNPIGACRCGNPPQHNVPEHLAIAASKALGPFVIGVNTLFIGQPVTWGRTQLLPDPSIISLARLWNAGTNMALPGSQHEKNLITNLTRCPNTQFLVQLGNKTDIPDFEYVAIVQNLVRLRGIYPNLFGLGVWNEANSANGAFLSPGNVGHKAQLCHDNAAGKLFIVGPTFQGLTAIGSLLPGWAKTYGNLVDALDHHIYYWAADASVYQTVLTKLVEPCVAIANSIGKPMWHTEGGLTGVPKNSVFTPKSATFLSDYIRAIRDGGSSCYLHWGWDNTDQPLEQFLRNNALTPTGQAFIALCEQNLTL